MRSTGRLQRGLAWLLLLGSLSYPLAQPAAGTDAAASLPAFPLDDVTPGLEGYGLTAGPGGSIETFTVTVLALQEGLVPGLPLVLVRAGGPLIERAGGVAAGMSGSPVYLPHEGGLALLGAIAYVFPETDGAVALVTPIEEMRSQAAMGALPTSHARAALAGIGAVPVATPVLIGGLGARALAMLDDAVLARAPHPLAGVQAGGAAGVPGAHETVAGSAVAIALVRGDLTVAAIGTVTEVAGERLLAFGHPFLGTGPASWPLAPAFVTAIVPSRTVPFKLANVGADVLGAVTQDRPAGIAAALGAEPDVVPVTLTVTTADARETLRFEVVADDGLWPILVAVASLEAIDRAWLRVGPGTADIAWEIDLEGGGPVRLTEQTSHGADVSLAAARLALAPLDILARNAFERARPTALQLAITIDERRRDAEVVEVLLDGEVTPEGGFSLVMRLQPWRSASQVRTFSGLLPASLEGELELRVRGGAEPRDEDDEPFDTVLLSYGELLTALRERPQGADLVIEVREPAGRWEQLGRLSLPYVVRGAETLRVERPATDTARDAAGDDPASGEEEHVTTGDDER